jgi:hypothetical protein
MFALDSEDKKTNILCIKKEVFAISPTDHTYKYLCKFAICQLYYTCVGKYYYTVSILIKAADM